MALHSAHAAAETAALSDVRSRLLGGRPVESIADVFRLLGDPTRVRLVEKAENRGRLEIEYYSMDDLSRIYDVIVGK